jgi:hypothetical protein
MTSFHEKLHGIETNHAKIPYIAWNFPYTSIENRLILLVLMQEIAHEEVL